jgi:predicted kinase
MVVIVFGLPGSGKSYFASRLAEQLNAVYLNTDRLRLEMFDKRSYSDTEKMTVYNRVLDLVSELIAQHKSVVVDGTFYKEEIRSMFRKQLQKSALIFIEVEADESVIQERLLKPREYSEADVGVYRKIKSQWEPMTGSHLVLKSSDSNINEMLATATGYINRHQ